MSKKKHVAKPQVIFPITVVSGNPQITKTAAPESPFRHRCWGYYFDRADAEYAIRNNVTDMSELGYYRYAVLSGIGEGIMALPEDTEWFEFQWDWNVPPRAHDGIVIPELRQVVVVECPAEYAQILFTF